jgi:hypothetical protein
VATTPLVILHAVMTKEGAAEHDGGRFLLMTSISLTDAHP